VVTNLSPNGWQLIYDGQTVSLYPSIGNWNFKCRSHYWITHDTVQWAENWSDKKIQRAKQFDGHVAGGDGTNSGGNKKGFLSKILRKKKKPSE